MLARDRYTCRHCGSRASHVDHVDPADGGGIDHPSNLQALCRSCNERKGRPLMRRQQQEDGGAAPATQGGLRDTRAPCTHPAGAPCPACAERRRVRFVYRAPQALWRARRVGKSSGMDEGRTANARDERARHRDLSAARRDIDAAIRNGLNEEAMSESEKNAQHAARADREAAAGDRREAAQDRRSAERARDGALRSGE